MAALPPFVDHCAELLAPLGTVRVRRMFGGWGFYVDGLFIAIVAFERLYLKAAPDDRERFLAAGCEPFEYATRSGQQVALGYWTAPDETLDSAGLMQPWARRAVQAALTARAAKVKPPARAGFAARPGAASARPATPEKSRSRTPLRRR